MALFVAEMSLTMGIVATLGVIACFFMYAEGTPAVGIMGQINCNDQIIDNVAGDDAHAIDRAISEAITLTPSKGYNYLCKDTAGEQTYWGHGACKGVISQADCEECLEVAKDYLYQVCSYNKGGHVSLEDCRMRFEHYAFNKVY